MDNPREEFWGRLDDVTAGMLSVGGGDFVPMSPLLRDDVKDSKVWFITTATNQFVTATAADPVLGRLIVAEKGVSLYADVAGTLEQVQNSTIVDELWNVFAGAWFEEGKHDKDVRLLCFTPEVAEVSLTEESVAKFMFEIAKANMTDAKPDAGWQGRITF
jgi:general stress protein 26